MSRRTKCCANCQSLYEKWNPRKREHENACRWNRISEGDPHYIDTSIVMKCGGYFKFKEVDIDDQTT